MKVYRHFTAAISGSIDIEALTKRVEEKHPDLTVSRENLPGEVQGIRLAGITRGTITVEDDLELDMDVGAFVFPPGIIIFEIVLSRDELPESVMERNLIKERVIINSGGEKTENPLFMHCWQLFFDILQFTEMTPALEKVNMVDDRNQMEIHSRIQEIGLIDTMFLGETIFFETKADFGEDCLIPVEELNRGETIVTGKNPVSRSGNLFRMQGDCTDFLVTYRFLVYRRNLLGVYRNSMAKWLELIGEESVKIRDRLSEKNKIYWSKLKTRLEVWDLNFLATLTAASRYLSVFQSAKLIDLSPSFELECRNEFAELKERLLENRDDITYGLGNLRTPCEAHDEDLLQRETEKGNERIMLLSFLAMSIPLLGAILAPGISLATKIISAVLLISAPLVYQYFRKLHLGREDEKAQLAYLKTRREAVLQGIKLAKKSIRNVKENPRLDDKTKASSVVFIEKTMAASHIHLKQLDDEIARVSGRSRTHEPEDL